jgi:hypothetical protein
VTAEQDDTQVVITPGQNSLILAGPSSLDQTGAGTVTLNAGDVLEVLTKNDGSQSSPVDVSGTLIEADKPVQVIGGHECTDIPDTTYACDHIEENMFPAQTLSTQYIVTAPLIPSADTVPKVEMVRILATVAGTTLTYDPPVTGAPSSIAAAGQVVDLPSSAADYQVTANHPILVGQYMEGQDADSAKAGDPALALAVAKAQYRTQYLVHAPTNYQYSYVNVMAPHAATITLDGTALPSSAFTAIGTSGYDVARQILSNAGNGNHTLTGSQAFGLTVYGYGKYTSYWYEGGLDLQRFQQ